MRIKTPNDMIIHVNKSQRSITIEGVELIGYRVVNKHGQPLALRNGASIFSLPFLAEKSIKKEFGKNDSTFDIEKHYVEEVAIINLSKLHSYFEEVTD